jgi:hypothetical protein
VPNGRLTRNWLQDNHFQGPADRSDQVDVVQLRGTDSLKEYTRLPTGPAVGPDGRLYVRDVHRVSRFGLDSVTGLLTRFEHVFNGPVYADWRSMRATRFDTAGALLYPGKRWLEDGSAAPFMIRYTPEGELLDTLFVPAHANVPQLTAWVRTSPGGGRMLRGLSHVPFAPLPAWDPNLGVAAHLSGVRRCPPRNDGAIWVRRWLSVGLGQTIFDVFTSQGEYQQTVVLPQYIQLEPTPFLSPTDIVGVAISPSTGENLILRFRAEDRR